MTRNRKQTKRVWFGIIALVLGSYGIALALPSVEEILRLQGQSATRHSSVPIASLDVDEILRLQGQPAAADSATVYLGQTALSPERVMINRGGEVTFISSFGAPMSFKGIPVSSAFGTVTVKFDRPGWYNYTAFVPMGLGTSALSGSVIVQ